MSAARDDPKAARPLHPLRRLIRAWVSRIASWLLVRAYLRPRLVDRHLPQKGPAIYCFNHLSWSDPFILIGTLPIRPRLTFFGPKEEDMTVGGRNRLMKCIGRRIQVRIGEPITLEGRASRKAVGELTRRRQAALEAMVADQPDHVPPGPFGRRVTELFNEWPEGDRAAAEAAGRARRAVAAAATATAAFGR